jgi:PAS domain S-box-containing protein
VSRPSLSRRLLTLVALVAAAGVIVDVLLWQDLDRRLRAEAVDHASDVAGLIAAETGIVLRQPVVDLGRAVARLDEKSAIADLDRYLRGSSMVCQVIVLDDAGRVIGVLPEDRELVGLDWSRQPLASSGDTVRWSETYLSPDRVDPGVTVSRRWRGGTVAFRIDLGLLSQLVAVVTPPVGGFVAVVDEQGVAIGHSQPDLARQRENLRDLALVAPATGEAVATRMTTWRGTAGLLCRSAIPGCGWSVLVFQPASHAFAVAREGALLSFGVLLSVIVLVVLMFLAVRRMLARALGDFAAQMERVAAGQPAGMADQPTELAPLATSFIAMAAAVTAREADLKRSQAEFRDLVEGVESVILRLDGDGRILYMNPAGERLFGWSNAEINGRHVLGTILPELDQQGRPLRQLLDSAYGDPDAMRHNQNENITRDGRRLWMSWANRVLRDAEGRLVGLLSVGTDLTEQVRSERAFQALVEAMAAAGGETFYEAATTSLENWLGCDIVMISRVVGARLDALALRSGGVMRREDCGLLAGSPCEAALREGWLLVEDGVDDRFPREDIVAKGIKAYAGIAVPGGKAILTCMWRRSVKVPPRLRQVLELIARRIAAELEAQDLRGHFAHAERLEALGKLAGGVAHDFNNQLAVILSSADLLRPRLTEPRSIRLLEGVITAAERSSALTARLLAFGRRGSIENGPVDLHAVVIETVQLAERTLGPSIAIAHELRASRSIVQGNAGLLHNALLNLALNARDAMPGGGSLRFATRDDGDRLLLEVADSGCGMDDGVLARLFEPFFTTKPAGKGNGLGLPAVYGTVTGMGGTITVRSAVGNGTTFCLSLPPCDPPRVTAEALQQTTPSGSSRILVAEDEPTLRQAVGDFLASIGHTVTLTADGQEAVAAVSAAPGGFDLVLLDAMMPRLTGLQAFERIRAIAPRLPVVVVSGFGAEADLEALRAAGVPVLAKPCRLDRLAEAIDMALHRPG